ncbi:MAG: hypothetical protein WC661_01365 [Opitutaceae bacterium]|jgi:hypothetical protein
MNFEEIENLLTTIRRKRETLRREANDRFPYAISQFPDTFSSHLDVGGYIGWFYWYVIMGSDPREYGRAIADCHPAPFPAGAQEYGRRVENLYGDRLLAVVAIFRDGTEGGKRRFFNQLLELALEEGLIGQTQRLVGEFCEGAYRSLGFDERRELGAAYQRKYWAIYPSDVKTQLVSGFYTERELAQLLLAHFSYVEAVSGGLRA